MITINNVAELEQIQGGGIITCPSVKETLLIVLFSPAIAIARTLIAC